MSMRRLVASIETIAEARANGVHVHLPAVVTAVEASAQRCSVIPDLLDRDGRPYPRIDRVPILYPRSETHVSYTAIGVGSRVLLLFLDQPVDGWLEDGRNAAAEAHDRAHDLSDAVAVPGLYPWTEAIAGLPTTGALFGDPAGARLITDDAGKVQLGTASVDVLDVLSDVLFELSTCTAGGAPLSCAATLTALKAAIDTIKGAT